MQIGQSDYLTIKNQSIGLHFNPQVGPNGREFKLFGTRKNEDLPEKWIGSSYKWHWIYSFIYLDDDNVFELEFDYNDNFVKKLSPTFMSGT